MKIAGEYLFEGPQDVVWDALMDPDVLASVLPGCEKLERVGEDEYEGALEIKIGPVQGAFKGKVKLSDIVKPDSYTMRVDGQGASGFVNATGHLKLRPEDGQTHVDYEGDAQVGGRLAAVGQRLVESSAKAIIKQSLDGLNEAVKARAAGGGGSGSDGASAAADSAGAVADSASAAADSAGAPGGAGTSGGSGDDPAGFGTSPAPGGADAPPPAPPSPPTKPSQAKFAANVAREVAADMIPAPVRRGLVIAAAAGLLYVLYLVFVA